MYHTPLLPQYTYHTMSHNMYHTMHVPHGLVPQHSIMYHTYHNNTYQTYHTYQLYHILQSQHPTTSLTTTLATTTITNTTITTSILVFCLDVMMVMEIVTVFLVWTMDGIIINKKDYQHF